MGAIATKYTPEARAAVVELILDDGLSGPEAVAELAAGVRGLPPCEMNVKTAWHLAQQERQRRESAERAARIEKDPEGSLVDLSASIHRQMAEVVAWTERQSPEQRDVDRLLKLTKGLADLRRFHAAAKRDERGAASQAKSALAKLVDAA